MSPHRLFVILAVLTVVGCKGGRSAQRASTSVPTTTSLPAPTVPASDTPVILLYDESGGIPEGKSPPPLEVAVWGDGRIVWRASGALLQSRVDTGKMNDLLQRLHEDGVFGNGNVECIRFGPDAAYQVVDVRLSDRKLWLASWHELAEQSPNVVATSFGLESLNGRKRDAVLAADSADYQRFRRVWADIRTTVKSWAPPSGEPFNGEVSLRR